MVDSNNVSSHEKMMDGGCETVTNKEQTALSILEYWHTIEFLGQDSYEACTNAGKLTQELLQYKKSRQQKNASRKQITVYTPLNGLHDIHSVIVKEAGECGMSTWGNLTFYVGKVKRQTCIVHLAEQLGALELQQAEESTDDIPVLSFQCDERGNYISHSLSLSTIVWALSQVYDKKDTPISSLLSEHAYTSDLKSLEKELFGEDHTSDEVPVLLSSCSTDETTDSEWNEDAVTMADITRIQEKLEKTYGTFFVCSAGTDMDLTASMKFQLFVDDASKEKYEDDNYLGLSHDFFSNDLKLVKNRIQVNSQAFTSGILQELVEYICAPYHEHNQWERHDLVKPSDREAFFRTLTDILDIQNAPLGKWPSRYMPALMQQVAINLAISDTDQGVIGKAGNIFSVNGPPGTGKTTMLKEVIAEHIVEKARLLSQYDEPDQAFEAHKFQHGDKNGAYSKFFPRWFSFVNDQIGTHGVLVVSCNNTAVENITKELPLSSGISSQLKVQTEGTHRDDEDMQQQLREISALFSISPSTEKIPLYKNDTERTGEYPEIYFTGYAQKLFGSPECDADAWGLIAAPLGKKSNIKSFYYDVLKPLLQDFMKGNQSIEERVQCYRRAQDHFLAQLQRVEAMRDDLSSYSNRIQAAHEASKRYQMVEDRNKQRTADTNSKLRSLASKLQDVEEQLGAARTAYDDASAKVAHCSHRVGQLQNSLKAIRDQELEYRRKALEAEKSVCYLSKFFRKSKYQAAMELGASYTRNAEECAVSAAQSDSELQLAKADLACAEQIRSNTAERLAEQENILKTLQQREKQLRMTIQHLHQETEAAKKEADEYAKACDLLMQQFRGASQTNWATPIDDALISDILSHDPAPSTQAQLVNPWVTQHYNREREKLFYLALQMTKEFLLSSKCCRTNLCILGQYWGLRTESDAERIVFHEDDRQAMASSLFQTLFLLTPVISSTFASVGRLLKDMREPGSIGTLMIDEAGQAQPQMAVGAIYRARRVLIVGDPKQVEPVVTDDLNLLKAAYSEPVYQNYKDKSLSVQRCGDIINPFGTFFHNGTDYPDWVGCPLLVHRRCLSPMYDISNQISYDGMMKQQTLRPSEKKEAMFLLKNSQWIDISGTEKGMKNHYVPTQGAKACELVELAFQQADFPNLYIISPFTQVVNGIRNELLQYAKSHPDSALSTKSKALGPWLSSNIGTVNKFQGKEADEVIFLLGCNLKQKDSYAVKRFVNSNIVNVAATRAKYRLYIIGDQRVWKENRYIREAKAIMDASCNRQS